MGSLEVQLAEYAAFLDRTVAPVEVPMPPARLPEPSSPRVGRRPLLVLSSAAAATVLAFVPILLLVLLRGDGPVTTEATTGVTGVVSILADAVFTWTRVADSTGALSGPGVEYVAQVIAGGPGLVAVGAADQTPRDHYWGEYAELWLRGWDLSGNWPLWFGGAVWLSSDGESWTRAADPEGVFASGVAMLTGVADNGSRLVAVGIIATEGGTATGQLDPKPAVWVSDDDGASWARVPHDEAAFGGEGRHLMWSVIATESGFMAAGDDLWTSPDGWAWTRVGPMEEVRRLARTPDGYAAVGLDGNTAVAWTSPDGVTWRPAELPAATPAAGETRYTAMTDVVAGPLGLIAVGLEGLLSLENWDGAVWLATEDGAWSHVQADSEVFAKGLLQEIRGVTVVGDRLVAVGTQRSTFPAFGPAQSWVSTDGGRTWAYIRSEVLGARGDDISMTTVAALGDKVVAMGTDGPDLAVWIGTWGGG